MNYKLKTVDVWDTLLRRDCHPECIKLATAAHVYFQLLGKFKQSYPGYWEIYKARIYTELRLARAARDAGQDEEYEIVQVFKAWLKEILECEFEDELAQRFADYELSVEMLRTFKDPDIEDFLKQFPAEKTVFLSDFYMSSDMLKKLLEHKGLGHLYDEGISSCDVGLNKRSGALFQHAQNLYGASSQEHVHIGDHPWSDVEAPQKMGIAGTSFLPDKSHAAREYREGLFASRDTLFKNLRDLSIQAAEIPSLTLGKTETAALRFGVEAAPLFLGFVLWISEQALLQNLDRIFFLTREGEFFLRIYRILFPNNQLFGHQLPVASELEVSRLSTFAASMRDVSNQELNRIWRLNQSQKVSGLFSSLGLDHTDFSDLLSELGLSPSDVIDDPENNSCLSRLINSETFSSAVKNKISEQRTLLIEYLKDRGITDGENVGIVDIGWRGTIQDNLARVETKTHFHGMYLGLRKMINSQPHNTSKSAYAADELRDADTGKLFESFAVLEMLCTSNKGSTEKYIKSQGSVIAYRNVSEEENSSYDEFSSYFQEGVALAAQTWAPYLERYVVGSSDLYDLAVRVWKKISENPGTELARIFIETPQHDIFGFGDIFQKNQAPTLGTIILSPLKKSARRKVLDYIRRVQWTSGVKQLEGISFIHKTALLVLFKLANAIKRYRMKTRKR
ncbi:HAD family hydrolase [Pseudomonas sp. GW456-12-1-14-TSB6]|uniref:HAD family hydrolase n=1 Tax=Pseudomonas sp. GW456-12-1-14-TSB6 TaxID=2751350 RepID=UPI000CD23D11|nr:HAD family hydrolase [Pseudomonas sp. GW456-12-1-14-TSB6]POA36573.1 hydrolase [Pseudomonas sp. GW456-12-1-14-TSB6]